MPCRTLFPMHVAGLLVFLVLCLSISGCRTRVDLSNYAPAFDPQPFERYRGYPVFMPSFVYTVKDAPHDYTWYYYSIDYRVLYTSRRAIDSYLWYAFQGAMTKAGMAVFDYPVRSKDGILRELKISYATLTDEELPFQAVLSRNGSVVYSKKKNIKAPPYLKGAGYQELEQRAYRMVDSAVIAILGDPDFQQAFFQ